MKEREELQMGELCGLELRALSIDDGQVCPNPASLFTDHNYRSLAACKGRRVSRNSCPPIIGGLTRVRTGLVLPDNGATAASEAGSQLLAAGVLPITMRSGPCLHSPTPRQWVGAGRTSAHFSYFEQ